MNFMYFLMKKQVSMTRKTTDQPTQYHEDGTQNINSHTTASNQLSLPQHSLPIDHELISTVILLPSADLFKKGFCQLQAKVWAQITG